MWPRTAPRATMLRMIFLPPTSLVISVERNVDEAETLRQVLDLRDVEVGRVVDDGSALGELVQVQRDRGFIECDEYVGVEHVAEDLAVAHSQVIRVVTALDERGVLGEIERLVSGSHEHAG